ncbi:hypothetical protein [Sodaliphilus pleomorphus]|jgi:hypothetical protein|uniref:Uncharacterized protein n=1 Tax=Sodaliphilus pleomorphus TaxID=2606626 RepID=A0A6L5XBZ6_9BACT|nr:hypothetical protein [Sodaliphilus pleomorphus]MSS16793.1 hypothetical protein [Sodaliphilus pleomorphus]
MNANRRKRLEKVIGRLTELMAEIDAVREDEQEAYDNMPEGLQYSERGEQMSDNIDTLDMSYLDLGNVINQLQEIVEA